MPVENIRWHTESVLRVEQERLNGHQGAIVWLTGSGKSTLAYEVARRLHRTGARTFVVDGDNLRHGLCRDLGFNDADRHENIRRVGEVASLFLDSGAIVLTPFISPFIADRADARALVPSGDFFEVYCNASVGECAKRDVKGLYRLAQAGEIMDFTRVSSVYEPPLSPELLLDTVGCRIDQCADAIIEVLRHRLALS
jgi:adenylylsulfate kinase